MFFLELSCFFTDPEDIGNLISGFSAFSKSSLSIWKFVVHILLKPGLENFEHYFASIGEGSGNPLQYCCLDNPLDGGAWLATVCGVTESWTWLSDFTFSHLIKGFGTVNKAEVDVFLEPSCFFYDPMDVGSLISGSSAFSKSSLNTWKFTVQVLLKPGLENFEHLFASVWNEYNCAVVWAFFGIAFLWDWSENWPISVLWPLLSFPNLLAYWVQHFHSIIF